VAKVKIVLGGSRQLTVLPDEVMDCLNSWCRDDYEFLIGDAKGTDAKFQHYLHLEKKYPNVKVYFSGDVARHNLGNWEAIRIDSGLKSKGHALHTAKDRVMTKSADEGLMIWDTLSAGTLANVIDLLQQGKQCQMYTYGEDKHLYSIKEERDLDRWRGSYPELFEEAKKRLEAYRKRTSKQIDSNVETLF